MSPEDLIVDTDGRPARIDKAFSWDAPIAAHGMMHMVIANAWKGDPYPIDTLFMYMANMAWNSAMNTAETMRMLTDKDPATGDYRIPRIIYSDAYYSEMVAYADLSCPTRPISSAGTASRCSTGRSAASDGPADAIRQPVLTPDRDVRPFQDVLIESRRAARTARLRHAGGRAALSRRLPRLHRQPRARPGVGPLGGWRGADGDRAGRGAPNPHQLERYVANGCFWKHRLPEDQLYFKHANKAYLETAVAMGLIDAAEPDRAAALCRAAAAAFASPPRAMARCCRPRRTAGGSRPISIRCRSGTCRSRRRGSTARPSRCTR